MRALFLLCLYYFISSDCSGSHPQMTSSVTVRQQLKESNCILFRWRQIVLWASSAAVGFSTAAAFLRDSRCPLVPPLHLPTLSVTVPQCRRGYSEHNSLDLKSAVHAGHLARWAIVSGGNPSRCPARSRRRYCEQKRGGAHCRLPRRRRLVQIPCFSCMQ